MDNKTNSKKDVQKIEIPDLEKIVKERLDDIEEKLMKRMPMLKGSSDHFPSVISAAPQNSYLDMYTPAEVQKKEQNAFLDGLKYGLIGGALLAVYYIFKK